MLKKLIATLAFAGTLISSAFALEVETEMFHGLGHQINMTFDTTDHLGQNRDNWVGVYKKGTSNDWDNVIKWAWLKDLNQQMTPDDFSDKQRVFSNTLDLEAGTYDFRIFLNNSFETFDSIEFTMGGDYFEKDLLSYRLDPNFDDEINIIIGNIDYLKDDSWMGIYKKGSSNDWENVIDWTWCSAGGPGSEVMGFKTLNYKSGEYEARFFLNNSYRLKGKVDFTVENGAETPKLSMGSRYANVIHFNSTYQENGGSWMALFKKGADSKVGNVVAWKWVTDESTAINIENIEQGAYQLRLFYNESYVIEAELDVELGTGVFVDSSHFPRVINDQRESLNVRYFIGITVKDKDWIAILNKGAQRTQENIIAWSYARNKSLIIGDIPNGEYDIVYFLNDSYTQFGRAGELLFNR